MQNIVVDTSIFISALLKSRPCVSILEGLKESKFNLILSEALLEEILIVAGNPKFEFLERDVQELKMLLMEKAIVLKPRKKISVCRDAKDNMVLEAAVAGNASGIVTGDKDLLVLKTFRRIPIVTPRQFLDRLSFLSPH